MNRRESLSKIDEVFSSPTFVVDVVNFLVDNGQIADSDWLEMTQEEKLKWAEREPN